MPLPNTNANNPIYQLPVAPVLPAHHYELPLYPPVEHFSGPMYHIEGPPNPGYNGIIIDDTKTDIEHELAKNENDDAVCKQNVC